MTLRRRAALAVLAAAAFAVFVLPASPASAVSVDNACRNSVTANNSQISVDTTADDSPDPVVPGGTVTLSNLTQTANVPGSIFVAGYNLGLLTVGENTIPATVSTFIEGTNTVEGVQQTNFAATSISTTIGDPDGTPSTGDESATDGSFTVTYNNLTFTVSGPDGSTIEFREDTRTPLSVATGAEVGGIIIRAVIGGFLSVRFACSPGTVAPPDPGTVTFIDPAPAFAATGTCLSVPGISIDDQTVTEGVAATFLVSFFGCGAGSELVTVDFATADGTAFAPGDYTPTSGTLTFAPGVTSQTVTVQTIADALVEENKTFFVNLSNATGPAEIFDSQGAGTILDVDGHPTANAGPDQTVDEGGLVNLDGTGSSDPNNETLTYAWTQTGGPTVTLTGADTATPTFMAPQVGPAGEQLTFSLEVCDEADPVSLCDTDTVLIDVLAPPPPVPPEANAGPDQTVNEGDLVTLDGTGSTEPQGETLTFNWTQTAGSAVTLSDPTSPTPTFTAPAGPASLAFTLEVCDPTSLCDTDTVVINVASGMVDAATEVIVSGPVGPSTRKTSKSFVIKVTNDGTNPITITAADITTSVEVNGTATGTVSVAGLPVTLNPGSSKRLKADWNYASGAFAAGQSVAFTACVNESGDLDPTNDCDTATVTAK